MNIVNVGYDSTNYYVLGQSHARLLVDVGFPGTLPKLMAQLKRKDIPFQHIGYLLATHYHPDHAGLAQEVKDRGVRLIVLESQTRALSTLKTYMKPTSGYMDITLHDNLLLTSEESRAFLKGIGITGGIISTPGHSDDSVTLVLEEGAAFTGDLPSPALASETAVDEVTRSWASIRSLHAKMIYPGHGPVRPISIG
jgi:glyoxylase-like metal-dependent hydrolase (beta-lactamase superfamily II)